MKYLPYILILLLLVGIIYQYKNPKLVETIKYKDSIKVEVKYRYKSDTIYLKDTIHKTDTIIKFVVDSIFANASFFNCSNVSFNDIFFDIPFYFSNKKRHHSLYKGTMSRGTILICT